MPVPKEPILFHEADSALIGCNDAVVLPQGSVKSDWEVELGVVIGTHGALRRRGRALEHVAGYCVVNDVSEREYQLERGGTWDKGKGCDTFGPVGPWLVTADEVPRPAGAGHVARRQRQALPERHHAHDDLRRRRSWRQLLLSRFMTLYPGDLIATGTPPGVGMGVKPTPMFLQAGRRDAARHRGPRRAAAEGARLGPGADRRLTARAARPPPRNIHWRQPHDQQTIRPQDLVACARRSASLGALGAAQAQTKLKWAHVYEVSEPYHKWSVWAGDEIKKRTNGRYEVQVFPASSLGKESDINQGLTLGTVDIILTGASFAARTYPPLAVSYFPFIFRDADHMLKYAKSDVFKELTKGYDEKSGNHVTALTYYGARQVTSSGGAADRQARGHEGPEDPRARRAGLPGVPEGARRQRDADRLRRGLPGAAERHRRRPGEPAADDRGEEVLRGAEEHLAHRPHHRLAADGRLRARPGASSPTPTRRSSPR